MSESGRNRYWVVISLYYYIIRRPPSFEPVGVPSRCAGVVHKNQLSNPSAKNCKEPCTPAEHPNARCCVRVLNSITEIQTTSYGCVGVWVYAYTEMQYFWSSGRSFLTSVGLLGAPREPSEHHVEEVANINRLFTKKSVLGLIVAPS